MTKRTQRRFPQFRSRPRAQAEQAWQRGYPTAWAWTPASPRQVVSAVGAGIDQQARALRRRGTRALRSVERALGTLAKRGRRMVTTFERERGGWLAAARTRSQRLLHGAIAPLGIASAERVDQLAKRVARVEQRLAARRQKA